MTRFRRPSAFVTSFAPRFRRPSAFVTSSLTKRKIIFLFVRSSVPSSSGLGRLVLIQKIAGSTPAGITRYKKKPQRGLFLYLTTPTENENPQGSLAEGE